MTKPYSWIKTFTAVCIHLLYQYRFPLLQKLPLISAAFGIGVQFSTLLYRYTFEFDNTHLHQYAREWLPEDQGPTTMTPMALLIGPDKETLAAFGYEAKKKYKELIQYANHNDFYYFPHFGMDLRKEFRKTNLENLTITDSTGKAIPVKTLLILALKFFQDDFLDILNKRRQMFCVTDISWTIIVPSFWTEAAKQFTMKAANESKILRSSLKSLHYLWCHSFCASQVLKALVTV